MKKALLVAVIGLGVSFGSAASLKDELKNQRLCKVTVCNKIERFSLNPFTHMRDSFGETCSTVIIPAEDAEVGKVLSSESRWWQGSSINPTKKSVTRVQEVHYCDK